MSRIAYYRVSTRDQSIESQRDAMKGTGQAPFDREFTDHGVSGATPAAARPGFAELLKYTRDGDTLHVYAVDRLGRDAIDVQATVRDLLARGITVDVHGLGPIAKGVGELILAVLAQVANMERTRIIERTEAGRATAREHLERTGLTHKGKASMGRPKGTVGAPGETRTVNPQEITAWRTANQESLQATADHFGVSLSSVKRYCATA